MKKLLFLVSLAAALWAQPLPISTPEKEGFSRARLNRAHAMLESLTGAGKRSGAIEMVVRNGHIVDWKTFGYRDVEAKLPMERDTICAAYSMSKVITSTAVLMLMEEGRFTLTDPVATYIPQLKEVQVFAGGTVDAPELVKPKRPVTIRDLLTHTSGMVYGNPAAEATAVEKLYARAEIFSVPTLKAFVERIAKLPLVSQPGEDFHYGVSTDVLGYLVEAVSGTPFEQFLARRIFEPLAMHDTFFEVPAGKQGRAARIYNEKDGRLTPAPVGSRTWPSGGGGLSTTIGDYARFAQMLLNGGELGGVRLLGRKTVELMMANHLPPGMTMFGRYNGEGFGLGGSVRVDLGRGAMLGSVGDFGWSGAASTWFRIDPKEKTIALLFMQHMPMDGATARKYSTLVYQAME